MDPFRDGVEEHVLQNDVWIWMLRKTFEDIRGSRRFLMRRRDTRCHRLIDCRRRRFSRTSTIPSYAPVLLGRWYRQTISLTGCVSWSSEFILRCPGERTMRRMSRVWSWWALELLIRQSLNSSEERSTTSSDRACSRDGGSKTGCSWFWHERWSAR